ncbi:MAG: hypothetical protein Q9173_005801 [Seirophora scorigena]
MSIEAALFGLPRSSILPTLMLALAKALSWYLTMLTTQHTSWRIATALITFSYTSTYDPFRSSSEVQALSYVMASFLALGQIIHTLPKHTRARTTFWAFSLVFLIPYLANVLAINRARYSAQQCFDHFDQHPVEVLIKRAEADFESLLRKQSQNYTAAHDEYQRRYGVRPPHGFEAWYEFATLHQSPIIDDFDMIYDNVSPFWRLSGKEVLETMSHVYNTPTSELWLCTVSGHQAKTHCSHHHRTFDRHIHLLFENLVGDVRGSFPDLKFLVNHIDEPRVLLSRQSGEISSRGTGTQQPVETFGLPFVTDALAAMDLCRHPEYRALHGLFMGPTSFRLIESLVPILSTGSPSTMGDIIYPSPAYAEPEFQYVDRHDVEWDSKQNNVYWAGSTTGGFVSDDKWRHYHRQRFVRLGQKVEKQQHYYLGKRNGLIGRVRSSFLNSRWFDVAFTRIFQCERKFCRDQRAFFTVKSWADKDRALRSRLVFDIDGNGISGRYYKLLASRSAPLKQTLLREWHDERLVPWLHYIPVSQSLEELPELVSYLTSTRAGQRRAKEVAECGRDWSSKALRKIDRSIYTYRLLLELARLQDPERRAGTGCAFTVLAVLAVGLRIASKRIAHSPFAIDDWLLLLALLIYFTAEYVYIYSIFYFVIIALVQTSILFFYRRIFFLSPFFRWTSAILIAVCVAWWIAAMVIEIGYPGHTIGEFFPGSPKTTLNVNYLDFWLAMGILEVFLQVTILILPIREVYRLQLSLKKQILCSLIFALGGFVIITGIVRLILVYQPSGVDVDLTQGDIWVNVHLGVAIICACLPTYRPLISRTPWLKLHSQRTRDSSKTSGKAHTFPSPRQSAQYGDSNELMAAVYAGQRVDTQGNFADARRSDSNNEAKTESYHGSPGRTGEAIRVKQTVDVV